MSMKAAQNVYKVLRRFEPSVIAAGKSTWPRRST